MDSNTFTKQQEIPLVVGINTSVVSMNLKVSLQNNQYKLTKNIKDIETNLSLSIFNYDIPFVSVVNEKPNTHLAIQLLEDEVIDDDEMDFVVALEGVEEREEEDSFSLTIEDAFLEELFLEDGWRLLHTVVGLRFSKQDTAKICADIYALVCESSNKWLNLILEN